MSNPTPPATGIYASRHAPKAADPNRVLPHMRKPAESPATPSKTQPGSDAEAPMPNKDPRQDTPSRLELNPRTAEFTPAEAKIDKPLVSIAPIIKTPTPSMRAKSPAGNFSLSEQVRGMAEQQRAVIAGLEDEIVEKKDEILVLRKQGAGVKEELGVLKGAWRIVDEMARGV